jgi:hypothetical protein
LLFHSTFALLFHSIFGAVSQYLLLLFQIIIGTVSSFIPGRVTVQLYSRPFSSFIPGCVTVQLYSSRFQLYSQPCYCTALFLAMLLFSIIQVLSPTVLPYIFIPGHLFAVPGLFIAVNNSNLFAVCRLFIVVKTIIICLLLFGSAQ